MAAPAYDDSSNHSDVPMIILYYCYPPTSILPNQLESHASFHKTTCHQLNLGGRIRVSSEGINGVVSGQLENLRMYDAELRRELMRILYPDHPYCSRLDINTTGADDEEEKDPTKEWLDMKYCHLRTDIPMEPQLFDSLSVKITREVVSLIEPASVSISEKKGRARCRQRRRQRRREKQRCEILKDDIKEVSELEVEDCEDATDPTISDNHFNEDATEANQEVNTTSTTSRKDAVDKIEYGTVVQIQNWEKQTPATHLSPSEWNEKLLQYSKEKTMHKDDDPNNTNGSEDVILLDTRNIYETRIGHFAVPQLPTFFPNTRKFSSLPQALNTEEAASALAGKKVFMYCTGGVRCERAGSYLRALSESNSGAWKGKDRPKGIYQLRGGIQKYLETYGTEQQQMNDETLESKITSSESESNKTCLYRGKNFVFDPRRTDPIIGEGVASDDAPTSQVGQLFLVGRCIICASPHDDYDNGHIPAEAKEARCCRCRVLVLVCNNCRQRVRSWGEPDHESKMDLYCGSSGSECVDEGNVAEKVEITRY